MAALPTTVWRALVGLGLGLGTPPDWRAAQGIPGNGTAYVLFLSALELSAAWLTLRLAKAGGDEVPRWSPIRPGHRLPMSVVMLIALTGAAALGVVCLLSIRSWSAVDPFAGAPRSGWSTLCDGCYLAALLWPPALVVAVVGYVRTRRATGLSS